MKKFASILTSGLMALSLLAVPVVVHAQDPDPILIDTPTDTPTTVPTTGAETPATPETGIAPPSSKLTQNALVFTTGGLLGAGLGLGLISYKKKQLNK